MMPRRAAPAISHISMPFQVTPNAANPAAPVTAIPMKFSTFIFAACAAAAQPLNSGPVGERLSSTSASCSTDVNTLAGACGATIAVPSGFFNPEPDACLFALMIADQHCARISPPAVGGLAGVVGVAGVAGLIASAYAYSRSGRAAVSICCHNFIKSIPSVVLVVDWHPGIRLSGSQIGGFTVDRGSTLVPGSTLIPPRCCADTLPTASRITITITAAAPAASFATLIAVLILATAVGVGVSVVYGMFCTCP